MLELNAMGHEFVLFLKDNLVFLLLFGLLIIAFSSLQLYYKKKDELIKLAFILFLMMACATLILWVVGYFFTGHTMTPKIFMASSVVAFAFLLTQLVKKYIWEDIFTKNGICLIPDFLISIVHAFIYCLALFGVLYTIDAPYVLEVFLISLGVLVFMSKDSIGDLFAAITLVITPAFRKGDTVLYKAQWLTVEDISWRFVILLDNNNNRLFVPTSAIAKDEILNATIKEQWSDIEINFQTALDAPPQYVIDLVIASLKQIPRYNKNEPLDIYMTAMSDRLNFSVNFPVSFVKDCIDMVELVSQIYKLSWYTLQAYGIPFYVEPLEIRQYKVRNLKPALPQKGYIEHIFRDLSIFKDFKLSEIKDLIKKAKLHYFVEPQKIMHFQDNDRTLHVIVEGSVIVSIPQEDGSVLDTATLHAGDCVGIIAFLTGKLRNADVRAAESVITFEIDFKTMLDMLKKNPEHMHNLAKRVAAMELEDMRKAKQFHLKKAEQAAFEKKYKASLIGQMRTYFNVD